VSAPRADFLLELGVEELPASYIAPALAQLERELKDALGEARLAFEDSVTFATPRRLAVLVTGLVTRQDDYREEATGPPAAAAWDKEGAPTKALLGFARGKGVDVAEVRKVTTDKGTYVAVTIDRKGKAAAELLPGMIARIVPGLAFPKTMRWLDGDGAAEMRFARPLRWIVALLGGDVLDLSLAGLSAGRVSRGHRFLHPGEVSIARPVDYVASLARAGVIADPRLRQAAIVEQAERLAAEAGGRLVADEELVAINNDLVETGTALLGRFDASYLDLPREVIVMALREHQRYFAVEDAAGTLLPAFVGVRNGDATNLAGVAAGNTAVLKARLDDARFYWDTDLARAPADRVADLAGIVWLEGMGTMLDKARRLEALAPWVAEHAGAPDAAAAAGRAATLCKTDLLSEMIGSGKEYASLEGVMGAHYAARHGEPAGVVAAIREHVRPKGAGDVLPASAAGTALAIADRADTVVGCFLAGRIPSGSEDPYGVRRAANGVVRILLDTERALSLDALADAAVRGFVAGGHAAPSAETAAKLAEFWSGRIATALGERGLAYDEIAAALGGSEGAADPLDVERRARALQRRRGNADFVPLVVGSKRVANILRAADPGDVPAAPAAAWPDPAEAALAAALAAAQDAVAPQFAARDYDAVLGTLLSLRGPIDAFFDRVMVNVEDAAVRRRRLGLLTVARALFDRGWDLSRVVVEG
jgi:glycyl-tRNA synthetase beta chain